MSDPNSPASEAPARAPQAALFLFIGALLALSMAVTYAIGLRVIQRSQDLSNFRVATSEVNDAFSVLKDAETGQRGYLLTGQEGYLAPYLDAKHKSEEHLEELRTQAEAGQLDPKDTAEFQRLANAKLAELAETVELRRTKGLDEAMKVMLSNQGKKLMDELRDLTRRICREREAREHEMEKGIAAATWQRTGVFIVVGLVNLIFLGWCYRRMAAEIFQRAEAAREVSRQKDLLAVTLLSIGDAVIITDPEGRITFMNAVALALTGWDEKEALGQPCSKVFHIINETTREVVESPVEKVLRLGAVVGLANHTLLIRRDGSEVPIDDSGAPVREAGGAIRGVVLVFRDFSEYKAAEKELIAANQAKDRFLAALSHELRTPLTPVLLGATALVNHPDLSPALRAEVQSIARNAELEARLIDDLLDLTAISKGKVQLRSATVDSEAIIRHVLDIVESDAHARNLVLTARLEAADRHLHADGTRLRQTIWNLLKNAVKFTPGGGRITIRTWNSEPGKLDIAVEDSGIGIAPENLDRVFRAFEQLDSEQRPRSGGLGLGLAIAKAIVDLHGGRIRATSAGPGQGATFLLQFATVPASPEKQIPAGATSARVESARILLVEDHGPTMEVLARLLRGDGHHVSTAGSVQAARERWTQEIFDLLISDLGLPDGSGGDLLQQLSEAGPVPTAIALSGYGMEEDLRGSQTAGFRVHIVKPVDFEHLREAIVQALAGK